MTLQPFAITEFKTGLFSYLSPWIRPQEAFEPLENAYVYRGVLTKRSGYSVYGRMIYQDNNIAVGSGGKNYTGTLSTHPIVAGSFNPTDGTESFTDDGHGVLTGSDGGTGTINYTSGAWTLNFNANVGVGVNIRAVYQPNGIRPIMGLKEWVNETSGIRKLVAMDTRRAAVYDDSTNAFLPISSINQTLWVDDGSTTSLSLSTGWVAVAPYTNALAPFSVTISYPGNTTTDDGVGGFAGAGVIQNTTTVNYATGVILLNLSGSSAGRVFTVTAKLVGDYFTGNGTNFFNATNWLGDMYMTNNVDRITVYDGTNLSRPPFPITLAHQTSYTNDITTCLDIDVYKNRFLVQRPTLVGNSTPAAQSIRWSALNNPTNLVANVTGNGGELSAPTDDFMQSSEFLRDQLIVFFTNSAWTFRFTGSSFEPFRFDKINNSKSTNAPYGTIPYDERITAMGSKGLIACDGVNVQRYDTPVIDQFLDIKQQAFAQCYGLRFDNLNQSWMLYASSDATSTSSDKVLVYNFIENTWATYDLPLSCLGLYTVTSDKTWNDFAVGTPLGTQFPDWDSADFPWNSYLLQDLAPTLLGGSLDGFVYQMNTGVTDNGESITASITSTRWNPFITTGQKVQFSYIDFYYETDSSSADSQLELSFFADNSTAPCVEKTITLDGAVNSTMNWKRVYVNVVGQFLQMNITSSSESTFKILGLILWASPAGRLTAGRTS